VKESTVGCLGSWKQAASPVQYRQRRQQQLFDTNVLEAAEDDIEITIPQLTGFDHFESVNVIVREKL